LCTEYKENILLVDPFIDSNKFQDIGNFENYENLDKRADLIVKLVKHDLFSEINSLNLPSLDFS
jgi:UDP-N-acetyl-D-mannosaminuronate dehydrogenase